jgi:hypothetical protein
MNRTKKGFFLAEETLKIIISVIVIGFLIYFLASLYFSSKSSDDIEFAKSSVKYLTEQMNSQIAEVQIYNPEDWVLVSWKEGELPGFCSNLGWKNCICICEDKDSCQDDGYCKDYNKEIFIKDESIKIDNPPITLEINYGDKIEVNKK